MVRSAGFIARFFKMDPVDVVDDDLFRYAFRVAAFNVVKRAEDAAAAKAKAQQASKNQ